MTFRGHGESACHKSSPVSLCEASRSSLEHAYVGVDMVVEYDKTVSTDHDDTASVWPQAGNDAGGAAMRARKERAVRSDYLSDALTLLQGWTRDGVQLNCRPQEHFHRMRLGHVTARSPSR